MRYVNATSWEYCRADAATLMTKAIGVLPQPMTAHWGIADPAPVIGLPEEVERAFRDAFITLGRRINLFLSLPLPSLDTLAIKTRD
jgi:hypothetical protein